MHSLCPRRYIYVRFLNSISFLIKKKFYRLARVEFLMDNNFPDQLSYVLTSTPFEIKENCSKEKTAKVRLHFKDKPGHTQVDMPIRFGSVTIFYLFFVTTCSIKERFRSNNILELLFISFCYLPPNFLGTSVEIKNFFFTNLIRKLALSIFGKDVKF